MRREIRCSCRTFTVKCARRGDDSLTFSALTHPTVSLYLTTPHHTNRTTCMLFLIIVHSILKWNEKSLNAKMFVTIRIIT